MKMIKVGLADEHRLFLDGLELILREDEYYNYEIVGRAHSGPDLLEMVSVEPMDVLITDIRLPEKDGLDLLARLKELQEGISILVITMYDNTKYIKKAFQSGSQGYILKRYGKKGLFEAIHEILGGNNHMGEEVSIAPQENPLKKENGIGNGWSREDTFILKHYLTERELEVLSHIALAKNNKEIAKDLYISDQTVSVHRKNIMRKLDVSNTAGLIKIAMDHQLVE